MIQGITSAFCIRIPVSVLMSKLPGASLMMVGMATPITTVYGILFFLIVSDIWEEENSLKRYIDRKEFIVYNWDKFLDRGSLC